MVIRNMMTNLYEALPLGHLENCRMQGLYICLRQRLEVMVYAVGHLRLTLRLLRGSGGSVHACVRRRRGGKRKPAGSSRAEKEIRSNKMMRWRTWWLRTSDKSDKLAPGLQSKQFLFRESRHLCRRRRLCA